MKRWIFLIGCALLVWSQHQKNLENIEGRVYLAKNEPNTSALMKTIKFPQVTKPKRVPSSNAQPTRPEMRFDLDIPEKSIHIGKSFIVIEDLKAVPKNVFSNEFGTPVDEDHFYIFYRPASSTDNSNAFPVAFHSSRKKLYPISSILHLKGVDEGKRVQLKAEGMKEYYYHPKLKLFSLETSPEKVLEQYQILKNRGLDVRLEVLKEQHQLK